MAHFWSRIASTSSIRPRLNRSDCDGLPHRFRSGLTRIDLRHSLPRVTSQEFHFMEDIMKKLLWMIIPILAIGITGCNSSSDSSTSSSGTDVVPWNNSITYGTLTDSRDGQTYKTVKIGSQTWMAQNLNYKRFGSDSGWCVAGAAPGSADSCTKYGRLYTWAEAMDTSSAYNSDSLKAILPHQGLCPSGWRVPSNSDWHILITTKMDSASSGTKLKSTSGWTSNTGTDAFGFRVLPAGATTDGSFDGTGDGASFWSSSESETFFAWDQNFKSGNSYGKLYEDQKSIGFSLRCLEN